MLNAFIGRQPIYNRDLEIYGYELLFRSGVGNNAADVTDGNSATSQVIINSFMEIGLENLVGEHRAFINLTKEFITGEFKVPFNPQQVVLEVLEDIEVNDETVNGLKMLERQMYQLALDDFEPNQNKERFLPYLKIVKLELPGMTQEEIMDSIYRFKKQGLLVLAEKVETEEEFEFCKESGADLFQGYFLSKPKIISGSRLPENHVALVQLLTKLQDMNTGISELEELISHDVSLSYKILKYINSAYFSLNSRVESIQRAIVYIGLSTIRQWVMIMALSGVNDKPEALLNTAILRSKMCELLAKSRLLRDLGSYSTIGLFSLIDALLDQPMEKLLNELPLSEKINSALLKEEGEAGDILRVVKAYEKGDWNSVESLGWSGDEIRPLYLEAISWTDSARENIL
jgi:EAL and modified HD-GYP domain-containing signal transduction protein